MRGIAFDYAQPVSDASPARMDVACFVGFVSPNPDRELPDHLRQWWRDNGFDDSGGTLVNRPVPIESWEGFRAIFDDSRMTRLARVHSHALDDPLAIDASDDHLHLIVDRNEQEIDLETGGGSIALSALVSRLNTAFGQQFGGAVRAELDTTQEVARLALARTCANHAGELTVYPNNSLGFATTQGNDDGRQETYLAAAVRAFFRQGGRKCYIVAMGDPLPFFCRETQRLHKALTLLWGETESRRLDPSGALSLDQFADLYLPGLANGEQARSLRQGVVHLLDLTDVAYLCLPDLAELFAVDSDTRPQPPSEKKPEVFVQCSASETPLPWFHLQPACAPRVSKTGFRAWKRLIDRTLDFLAGYVPDTQLIAALPLPDARAQREFEGFATTVLFPTDGSGDDRLLRLQLVYPWLKTYASAALPESVEPGEGTLVGVLANSALTRGAFRSVAGTLIDSAYDRLPVGTEAYAPLDASGLAFHQRICFFDTVPAGIALESDVTTVSTMAYRYAVVRRIMLLVRKAAGAIGLNYVFDTSNQRVWKSIENAVSGLLMDLYQQRALRGRSATEAFSVVCDRSTLTQQDIDNGRFIVTVALQPAVPIERMTVNMVVDANGRITQ